MKRNRAALILKYVVIFLISLAVILPFWDMIINSFKSSEEAAIPNIKLPRKWQISENYSTVIEKGKLINSFKNSLIITGSLTIIILIISTMAAFVFGRRKEKFIRFIFFIFLIGIITPPSFIVMTMMMKYFNLLGTYIGMILIFSATFCSMPIFMITGFMSTLPKEIEEAAIIDGASPIGIFVKVMLPILKPAIATSFIWVVLKIWNDFLFPIYILAGNTKKYTMTLSLYYFRGQFYTAWNLVFADLILISIPVMIAFIFAQRNIVKGLTAGAVKG
jgi:raffinose/stachyose/melibiose transport system permease protein